MQLVKGVIGRMIALFTLQWVETLGAMRYVGRAKEYSQIELDDIIGYASKATNLNEADMRRSLDALFDALNYFVTEGHPVELPYLGTFSFGIQCKATFSEEEAKDALSGIRAKKVLFKPSVELRQLMNNITWTCEIDENGNTESGDPNVTEFNYGGMPLRAGQIYLYGAGKRLRIYGANLENCTLRAVVYDADGEESTQNLTMERSGKNFYEAVLEECYGIQSLTVLNDGNLVKSITLGRGAGDPYVANVKLNGLAILPGNNTVIKHDDGEYMLEINGFRVDEVAVLVNDEEVAWRISGSAVCDAMLNLSGNSAVIKVGNATYNIAMTTSSSIISTLTANGVTVQNGGSSAIIAGQTYHFVAAGSNLSGITSSVITGPGTVSNLSASANQVNFDFVPSGAGNLNIADLFSVTLTAATSGITSIGGVSNGGSKALSSASESLAIVGTVPEDATVTVSGNGSATAAFDTNRTHLNISNANGVINTITIQNGTTTIFQFTVSYDDLPMES